MTRNLTELREECSHYGIGFDPNCSKSELEWLLGQHIWNLSHPGIPVPEQIVPMLARSSKDLSPEEIQELFDSDEWVGQEKINGCRCMLKICGNNEPNQLTSRVVSDQTHLLGDLSDKLPHYRDMRIPKFADTILDGEILAPTPFVDTTIFDGKGVKTLDILQATTAMLNCDPEKSIALQEKHGKLVLHVFDCLRFRGADIRHLPYVNNESIWECRYTYACLIVDEVINRIGTLPCSHCDNE